MRTEGDQDSAMYFTREVPVVSNVYRSMPVKRYIMMPMGGFWPVVQKLPDGRLGVVTRDGDFHFGERGRLVFVTSADGGESWSRATLISADGPDNRDPAFGVAPDGTLLTAFVKMDVYTEGQYDPSKFGGKPLYISRSEDGGATWNRAELAVWDRPEPWLVVSPFGKMITLDDGAVLMHYYVDGGSYVVRSYDSGRTWADLSVVADGGFNETQLCPLGNGRMLALMRDEGEVTASWQTDSSDQGHSWSEPRQVTGPQEHPADVIRLNDGRLLTTYGRRVKPKGVQAMVSHDEGATWDTDNRILLVGDSDGDCGYPSSLQRDDGTIVTVYYAENIRDVRGTGYHGGALLYRPEDLP